MKTPKEYNDNIKNGIITSKMLTDCLYSVNKRAKIGVTRSETGEIVGMIITTMRRKHERRNNSIMI